MRSWVMWWGHGDVVVVMTRPSRVWTRKGEVGEVGRESGDVVDEVGWMPRPSRVWTRQGEVGEVGRESGDVGTWWMRSGG